MQVKKPENIKNIDSFYNYVKKLINNAIDTMMINKLINEIEAHVYIPLSFMNVAVIFVAESFEDICTFLKNVIFNNLVDFQYSILTLNNKYDENNYHKISLSLRFIWGKGCNQTIAIDLLKSILDKQGITNYNIMHLIGNNDCVLTVVDEGYKILNLILSTNDVNGTNDVKEFFTYTQNTRATIRFNDKDIKIIEIGNDQNANNLPLTDKLKNTCELIKTLKTIEIKYKLIEIAVSDLIYKVNEFDKFVRIIYEYAKNGIAIPLYKSIINPYNKFIEISTAWAQKL